MEKTISPQIYEQLNEANKISSIYPQKSYEMAKKAYNMSRKNNLKKEEGYALISMTFACRAKSETIKMLDYSFNALEIFEEINDQHGQIKSLNLIGIAYIYNYTYEVALKYFLRANDLLSKFKDDYLHSCVLNNIGEIYRDSFSYETALEYFNKSLKICTDNNYKINSAVILGNIGEVYFVKCKYSESLEYLYKSYNILINEKEMISLGEIENKLGKVYYKIKNYNKAEEYFFSSLNRLEGVNNKYYAIDTLINIANLNLENYPDKSLYYLEIAMRYAVSINSKKKLCEVYRSISEYYEKLGDYKASLEYYKNFSQINEEIMSSSLGNKLQILKIELGHLKEAVKFEKLKNRLEIEIANQKNELVKIKKSNELLEKKANEDELTGVPNRRYLNNYLLKTWEQLQLNDENIAILMIDIDNFKKYNDYWGHTKGDECLKKIADCINNISMVRKDIFGRYGGEEFVYYARNINYDQALELGNLIRTEVQELGMNYMLNNENKSITISVGGSIGKITDFNCVKNMMEVADKELYNAKDLGKNTTSVKVFQDNI